MEKVTIIQNYLILSVESCDIILKISQFYSLKWRHYPNEIKLKPSSLPSQGPEFSVQQYFFKLLSLSNPHLSSGPVAGSQSVWTSVFCLCRWFRSEVSSRGGCVRGRRWWWSESWTLVLTGKNIPSRPLVCYSSTERCTSRLKVVTSVQHCRFPNLPWTHHLLQLNVDWFSWHEPELNPQMNPWKYRFITNML